MYKDVKTFIEACDQERNDDNIHLYGKLIREEHTEFWEAESLCDEVEQLDACMDMIWVILGYCYMKGWDVKGAWNEVALSNLLKIDPITKKVKKREDGKVLKPEGWKPPQLKQFTEKK
jgi:predicted HAD superfamily Cof-like phosphohydrolase